MTEDKRRRGFTLIELIVVLAIIVILIALIAPNAVKLIDTAAKTTCDGNIKTLKTEYLADTVGQTLTDSEAEQKMQEIIAEHGGSAKLCPKHGNYTVTVEEDGEVTVTCSIHGAGVRATHLQALNVFYDAKSSLIQEIFDNCITASNPTLQSTDDSPYVAKMNRLLREQGYDTSKGSWVITGSNGAERVYWCEENFADLPAGSKVQLYCVKFSAVNKQNAYVFSATGTVSSKWVGGKQVKYLTNYGKPTGTSSDENLA